MYLCKCICVELLIGTSTMVSGSKEAYFNGSAYLRLLSPMPIWDHSAISFRSCRGKFIFEQYVFYNYCLFNKFIKNMFL